MAGFATLGEKFDWAVDADSVKRVCEWVSKVLPNHNRPTIHLPSYKAVKDIHDIKTLEDCLTYFHFPELLQELEDSLESVRKRKKTKEEHEEYTKGVDKKLQKLSFKYHPDKASNRGGSVDELATAQKLQTALNSTRTVLRILHKEFLKDLDIDHKYGFYAKLEISSLGNEEQIKKEISDVLYKTVLLSEIKQVDIIAQIRMFLRESQASLNKYLEKNETEFKKYRNYALYHLKKCIDGYEKLLSEFKTIDEECKSEKLVHIASVMKKMADKSSKESGILKKLKDVAKYSLDRHFRIFSCSEHMDEYLILPFVYYVNVLLICTLMLEGKRSILFNLPTHQYSRSQYVPLSKVTIVEKMLNDMAYSAISLNEECQTEVKSGLEERSSTIRNFKDEINSFLTSLKIELEKRFSVENYEEGGNKKYLLEHYAKLRNKAAEIDDTILKIFKDMHKCQNIEKRTKEHWETVMKDTNTFEKEITESLKQSNLLQEKVSKVINKNRQEYQDEICMEGTDELDEEIAESLKQSKLLHEQVWKILQRKDEEIMVENVIDFVRSNELKNEVAHSLEKRDLLQEQDSTKFQAKDHENKVESKNGKESNLLQEKVSKVIHKGQQEYGEKDEICMEGTDELEEEIAESLKHNKLLREQDWKILQRKDEESMEENATDFVRSNELKNEVAHSLEKRDLLKDQDSTIFQ